DRRAAREITIALCLGRHGASPGTHRLGAQTFVRTEIECLVLLDRPAERRTVVVSGERRDLRGAEEPARIKAAVTVELVNRSVKLIRSGLGRDDDLAARLPAVLRAVRSRKDAELLDAIDRRPDARLSGGAIVVVDPVEHEVIGHFRIARDVE